MEFDRKDINMNKLVVTTLESKFHVFDMRTQHPQKGFASLTEKVHYSSHVLELQRINKSGRKGTLFISCFRTTENKQVW